MRHERILVVGLGRIGDLVLITPIFGALRAQFPGAQIHLLAGRNNFEVALGHPHIDRVHVYWKTPARTWRLLHELRRERFDLWIDPKDHGSNESRLFVTLAKPRTSFGFNARGGVRFFTGSVLSRDQQRVLHATKRAVDALGPLGIAVDDKRPSLAVDGERQRGLQRFLAKHSLSSFHLVNVSSNSEPRCWRADAWISLLNTFGCREHAFLVCASPCDRVCAERIVSHSRYAHFYPTESIRDLLPAVRGAQTVLSVDTCIVHIASAFDTPIVALYANTPGANIKYAPLSEHNRVLVAKGKDAPVNAIPFRSVREHYQSLLNELMLVERVEAIEDPAC